MCVVLVLRQRGPPNTHGNPNKAKVQRILNSPKERKNTVDQRILRQTTREEINLSSLQRSNHHEMVNKSKKPPAAMHIVQHRTQSFSKSVKVSKNSKVRWPHETPIPEDLALAGFYYLPYQAADDNVCCYLCGKNMGGWEEEDDPLKEHLRGNKSCAWAVLRDLLVRSKNGEEFGDNVEDPRSEKMNKLREATFGEWWPHDEKKGWNPKSKKV
jgi:Inhibitor of Apoptosis domain